MQVTLWVLLIAAVVYANESQERRSKLPYVADALGNTLPPPSNLPATVGSPVNLLTPDRYEFYTFDESGELVKRLMTLEEIQAIVAAGEETEGLVTFANDNQPTIAFNFSQPPYTKVHSVVTNVQNVLKAQMEAHKNKPHMRPTLDTPDVSDSWSLILPSIFGNTGVDIIPDKTTGNYMTPETETIEIYHPVDDGEPLSKEGSGHMFTTSTPSGNKLASTKSTITTSSTATHQQTTSTTTLRPTTTKHLLKPSTNTPTNVAATTTTKPKTTISTTTASTSSKPTVIFASNVAHKNRPMSVTVKSTLNSSSTTEKPIVPSKTPLTTTISSEMVGVVTDRLQTFTHVEETTERGDIQYERVSTLIPVSTFTYLTERTTKIPLESIKVTSDTNNVFTHIMDSHTTSIPKLQSKLTTNSLKTTSEHVYSSHDQDIEKNNSTTITTQSVLPSTTMTYTQSTLIQNSIPQDNLKDNQENINTNNSNEIKVNEPIIPLFDVAQSISQIASDLGGAYRPMTTSSYLLETTKIIGMDLESKENLEIDIPPDSENNTEIKGDKSKNADNYVKISTIDPPDKNENTTGIFNVNSDKKNSIVHTQTITPSLSGIATTLDPVLSESMGDLLSQVSNETPDNNFDDEKLINNEEKSPTTELVTEISTEYEEDMAPTTEMYIKDNQIVISTETHNGSNFIEMKDKNKEIPVPSENNKISDKVSIKPSNITENQESFVKIFSTTDVQNPNATSSEVKSTASISSTELIPDVKKEKKDSYQSEIPKTQINSENTEILKLTKEDMKSTNSSLPSYKAEIESNNTNKLENTSSHSHKSDLIEEKGLFNNNPKEKGQDLVPKIDEFKKKIQKVNIDDKELGSDRNNSWKLIPTLSPPKMHEIAKSTTEISKMDTYNPAENNNDKNIALEFSKENQGLELTTKDLGEDIEQFSKLCNELAFRYWNDIVETIDKKRSFVFSPYAVTSMLAMMFMGARGATSGEMNDILKLDDMVTFNPHFTLKNISDSIETTPTTGVVVSAFIRELYSDRSKGKILTFYKERAQHFYNGHVEEVNFKLISDIIRRRTNLLVKRYTWGKILEYMKANTIVMQPPLAAFSANIFQTDCSGTSIDGRDGELYFVVSPNVRQRRLVPVPAVVYKNNFLAGYDPVLDATAAALGNTNSVVSTLFVMPGQQGNIVHAEDLEELEERLLGSSPTNPAWNQLLRTLLPRVGLELQIPRFSHKSTFNISSTLKRMGLKDLFDADHADLGGLNGPSKDLYLSDMIQTNTFVTCGEGVIGEQHHIEQYPELGKQKRRSARWVNGWDEPRDYQRAFHDPHDVGEAMHLPLHLRPRQARLPARNAQPARLKFDRPFLFFVRHNPSGMILYVGRYNPRLLP